MGEAVTAPKMTDERIHQIARALADPRRMDLLRRIGQRARNLMNALVGHLRSCDSFAHACMLEAAVPPLVASAAAAIDCSRRVPPLNGSFQEQAKP